jgi:FKBP-type peptidyl-prolyl cis-trans isomerase SlyD
MRIHKPCVASLTWVLHDAQNRPIDELVQPVEFLVGGNDLLAAIETALEGHAPGDEVKVQVEPEQAFGDYRPGLVCFEARALFPEPLEAGMTFEGLPAGAVTPDMPKDTVYVVTEVYPTHVVLDGNHPLAGMALRLTIRVREVREASADEIDAGSAGADASALWQGGTGAGRPLH